MPWPVGICMAVSASLPRTQTQTYLPGLDGGSIGAVAVHPSRRYLAVAEKCRMRAPNIYVYEYPSLTLAKVLRDGTERAFRYDSVD
jgi:cilia- and flagella-associated protein 44